jgi:hypothetical protein
MANTRQLAIHVQEAQLTGDLTDFPVLITRLGLHNEVVDPTGGNRARADGGDLRAFAMVASVKTALPLDVAEFQYDSASAAGDAICNLYVKVPALTTASGADIILEYGDAALTQPAVTAPLGRNAVWSGAAYATHDLIKDRTGATADAVWTGTIQQVRSPANIPGIQVGQIHVGDNSGKIATSFIADQRPVSYLVEYRFNVTPSVQGHLWTQGANSQQTMASNRRHEYRRSYNGVQQLWRASVAQSINTNWRSHATVHDIDALAGADQYRDDTLLSLNATGVPSNPIDSVAGSAFIIGNDSGGATAFQGSIGPIWIWKTLVGVPFIMARHNMYTAPATFLTAGAPTAISGGSVTATIGAVLAGRNATAAAAQKFLASVAASSPASQASLAGGLVWRGSAASLLASLEALAAASLAHQGAAAGALSGPLASGTSSSAISGVTAVMMRAALAAGDARLKFAGGAVADVAAAVADINAATRFFAAGAGSAAPPRAFASSSSAISGLVGALLRAGVAAGDGNFAIISAGDAQFAPARAALLAAQQIDGAAAAPTPAADSAASGVYIFNGVSSGVLAAGKSSSSGTLVSIMGAAAAIIKMLRAAGNGAAILSFLPGVKSFMVTARGRTLSVSARSTRLS